VPHTLTHRLLDYACCATLAAGSTAKGTVRFQPLLTANWEQLQELERQEQERGEEQDEDGVKREKKGEEDEDNEEEGLGGRRR